MARCRRLFRNLIYVYMFLLTSFVLIRYTPSISSSSSSSASEIRDEDVKDAESVRPIQPASVVQQPEVVQQVKQQPVVEVSLLLLSFCRRL